MPRDKRMPPWWNKLVYIDKHTQTEFAVPSSKSQATQMSDISLTCSKGTQTEPESDGVKGKFTDFSHIVRSKSRYVEKVSQEEREEQKSAEKKLKESLKAKFGGY